MTRAGPSIRALPGPFNEEVAGLGVGEVVAIAVDDEAELPETVVPHGG